MYHVKFDPNGQLIKVQIDYLGTLTASYVYTLWEKNSNAKADEKRGNNQNSQDDKYELPSPVQQNAERIIEVFSTLTNPDVTDSREIVAIKILQGNTTLFSEEDPAGVQIAGENFSVVEEKIVQAGTTELSDPFIKLIV